MELQDDGHVLLSLGKDVLVLPIGEGGLERAQWILLGWSRMIERLRTIEAAGEVLGDFPEDLNPTRPASLRADIDDTDRQLIEVGTRMVEGGRMTEFRGLPEGWADLGPAPGAGTL